MGSDSSRVCLVGSGPRTTATSSPQVREAPSLLQHSSFRISSSHTVPHSIRTQPAQDRAPPRTSVPLAGETIELMLSDGFPGAFRWGARPALRYAISPDFCSAMKGTMVEEDGWLRDAWPIVPPVRSP